MAKTTCFHCGATVPPGAKFCPACGKPVTKAPPPASPARVRRSRSTYLIWVPIALVALALLAWAVLSGFPFSRDEPRQAQIPTRQIVQEPSKATTATVSNIGPVDVPSPPPVVTEEPPPKDLNEEKAISYLHSIISKRGNVSSDCLVLLSEGFRSGGYTVSARDRCKKKPAGRWRLGAKTKEVSRLKP
jgi:zinc ribbon protein